ncbi:kunitz-type protease inhibitor 2-like isoform X1 [Carassius gibelio]|uniref:kunitz-type protease inhibitor 2-like isoform X1 n=1 Tax=Carassius gibelio TaxID=101364 RepID=UPI0022774777|nr:kunitz-type protease inhibitor 2-like isoform X1 [Carassius gibelio]
MAQVCFTASLVGFICCLSVLNACKWDPDTELEQGLDVSSFDNGASHLAHLPEITDAERCQRACCERDDCQLAVIGTPADDGRPECILVSCIKDGKDVCVLTQSTQFKVYRKIPDSADPEPQNKAEVRSKRGTDHCQLPSVVGICRAAFPRFYYDVTDQTCKRFIYGGCGGNDNNFNSQEECEASCSGVTVKAVPSKNKDPDVPNSSKSSEETCAAPSDSGPCRAAFPMFYFDSSTQSCKSFIYGGCKGNLNRYNTEEECMAACSGKNAFILVATLAIIFALLLVGLILIAVRRNYHRSLFIFDKEELLPAEEQVSYEKLPEEDAS